LFPSQAGVSAAARRYSATVLNLEKKFPLVRLTVYTQRRVLQDFLFFDLLNIRFLPLSFSPAIKFFHTITLETVDVTYVTPAVRDRASRLGKASRCV
jgi:hypothetical protein